MSKTRLRPSAVGATMPSGADRSRPQQLGWRDEAIEALERFRDDLVAGALAKAEPAIRPEAARASALDGARHSS